MNNIAFQPLKNRSNEGPIFELTPQTGEIASPLSLSIATGLNQQPMHADGAHLRTTPDFVQLLATTLRRLRQCAAGGLLRSRTITLAAQHLTGRLRCRPAGLLGVASRSPLPP